MRIYLNVDFTKLSVFNNLDPKFQYNIDNKFSLNIGAGVFWYSDKTYIGLSVPNFLETKRFDRTIDQTATNFMAKERMTFYAIAGKVFDLSDNLKFKPSFMTKIVSMYIINNLLRIIHCFFNFSQSIFL